MSVSADGSLKEPCVVILFCAEPHRTTANCTPAPLLHGKCCKLDQYADTTQRICKMISGLFSSVARTSQPYARQVSARVLHTTSAIALKHPPTINEPAYTKEDPEISEARKWLSTFSPESIPRDICDVSFARSSGPGGQNVNKSVVSSWSSQSRR